MVRHGKTTIIRRHHAKYFRGFSLTDKDGIIMAFHSAAKII